MKNPRIRPKSEKNPRIRPKNPNNRNRNKKSVQKELKILRKIVQS